jgi:hypothetical protein
LDLNAEILHVKGLNDAAKDKVIIADKNKALKDAAVKKLDKSAFPDSDKTKQDAEIIRITNAFTDDEKSAIFKPIAESRLHDQVLGSEDYLHGLSLALRYISDIKEVFFAYPSAVEGKTNADLIGTAGRNVNIYDIVELSEADLAKVADNSFDWKSYFKDANTAYICVQERAREGTLGSMAGGLANVIDWGSDSKANLKKFTDAIESKAIVEFIQAELDKVSGTTEDKTKKVASILAAKLETDVAGIKVPWQAVESYAKVVLTGTDVLENMKKHDEYVDNLKLAKVDSKDVLVIITDPIEVSFRNMMREGDEEWNEVNADGLSGKEVFGNLLATSPDIKDWNLLVGSVKGSDGSVVGMARDPMFANLYGAKLKDDTNDKGFEPSFTTPECWGIRVSSDTRKAVNLLVKRLEDLKSDPKRASEVKGVKKISLWSGMLYSGAIVNSADGDIVPLAASKNDGAMVSPLSEFDNANKAQKHYMYTYAHEAHIAGSAAIRDVTGASFAAAVLKLKSKFVTETESVKKKAQEDLFAEFLTLCQNRGYVDAVSKISAKDKVEKFKSVAEFLNANKSAIVEDAKVILGKNFKSITDQLAQDVSAKNQMLDFGVSADFIFWKTDNPLACLAQNYFGQDTDLLTSSFIEDLFSKASANGREVYFKAHTDIKPAVESFESAEESVVLALQVVNDEVKILGQSSDAKSFLENYTDYWFGPDADV